MTDKLATYANGNSPKDVHVPGTWAGLVVWAVGKFGIGVVFLFLLGIVYVDLREAHRESMEVNRATTEVLGEMARQLEQTNIRTTRIEDVLRARGYYQGQQPPPPQQSNR